jgi:hypothetical protein
MSTGTSQPTDGQPNSQTTLQPDEPGSATPDRCQLQTDAVAAAGREADLAMRTLGERLKVLRECRAANGLAGFNFNGASELVVQLANIARVATVELQAIGQVTE